MQCSLLVVEEACSHTCSSFSIPLQLPPTSSLLRSSASCLKAVCSALAPDSLIPSRLLLVSMYSSSCASYEPHPVNISHIVLPPELREFVENFATYQHDCWSYEQVGKWCRALCCSCAECYPVFCPQHSEGWTYGSEKSDKKQQHPYLRPFSTLPEQVQCTTYLLHTMSVVKCFFHSAVLQVNHAAG